MVLICQLLEALEYGHAKNLVHGDIKPANLLISATDGEEVVKVADFGLARVYQASQLSGLSMTADIGDSAGFLPPERITNYREVAPPADQYAAAATLYTLLTGEHVFDLPSEIHRRISLILQAQPVPIHQRRADVSPELAAVLHKALAQPGPTIPWRRRLAEGSRQSRKRLKRRARGSTAGAAIALKREPKEPTAYPEDQDRGHDRIQHDARFDCTHHDLGRHIGHEHDGDDVEKE